MKIQKKYSGIIIVGIQERKEREKKMRRQQILVAAKRVFSEKGFNKSTMEDIASEAEVSQGTLYQYFRNKEEMFASLSLRILQYLHIWAEHVNKESDLTPEQKVDKIIEIMYDVYDFDPLIIINLFRLQSSETLKNKSHSLMTQIDDLYRKSISAISNIFKEGNGKGVFIEKNPVVLSDIFGLLFSEIVLWEASRQIMDIDKEYLKKSLPKGRGFSRQNKLLLKRLQMIRSFNSKTPNIAESAFVSEAAYIVGDVEIGENSSVWPGAVIRGDFGKITIGNNTAIEDNCVIHSGTPSNPIGDVFIGNRVHIGHGAVLNCTIVGDDVLVGMNATILHDVTIGSKCIIGANCLVRQGMKIPDNSFVVGVPGKIKGSPSPDQQWWLKDAHEVYARLARKYKSEGL